MKVKDDSCVYEPHMKISEHSYRETRPGGAHHVKIF